MNSFDENMLSEDVSPKNVITEAPSLILAQQRAIETELVMLDCGDFGLFIPAVEVVSIASAQQIFGKQFIPPQVAQQKNVAKTMAQNCGYLELYEKNYAVFCFDKTLQLHTEISAKHNAVVLLKHKEYLFGISCCELLKQQISPLTLYSVPPSMRSRKQPFTEFAVINNRAVGLSSVAALYALLHLRGVIFAAQQTSQTSTLQGVG